VALVAALVMKKLPGQLFADLFVCLAEKVIIAKRLILEFHAVAITGEKNKNFLAFVSCRAQKELINSQTNEQYQKH